MSERLGASFEIDVTNLKAGLTQANRLIRESESEFKAAAAGMDDWSKSEAGLNAKIKSLSDITDLQRKKVNGLQTEYDNLIEGGLDPTSAAAVKLRTQINNETASLNKNEAELQQQKAALSTLVTEQNQAGDAAEEAGDAAEEAGKKVKESGENAEKGGDGWSKFGTLAKSAAKAAAAAAAAAGTAVVGLVTASVNSYSDYEQLVGGVETLFKDSSDQVVKYAESAYKTAGLSANEYMETVTGFSASLISSLDGDTAKAAKVADVAITNMSDNANKMGTDMESIQNAYSGFAKSNFDMLDNLKLGYGGNKTEMERLLSDAEKLSGVHYDISNFSDIAEAINVIQQNMGISGLTYEEAMQKVANGEMTLEEATEAMGTTAKEAATTIQGSLNMTKAAWQNVLTGMADESADFEGLIDNLIGSIEALIDNLVPRIQIALNGVIKLVKGLLPQIPPIIEALLPDLITSIIGLLNGIMEIAPQIIAILPGIIDQIAEALPLLMYRLTNTIMELVTQIIAGLAAILPNLLGNITNAIVLIAEALVEGAPQLLEAAIELLTGLIKAVPIIISELTGTLPELIDSICYGLIGGLPAVLQAAVELLEALVDAIPTIIELLVENLPTIISAIVSGLTENVPLVLQAAITLLTAIINAIPQIVSALIPALPKIISAISTCLIKAVPQILQAAITLFWQLIKAIPQVVPALISAMPQIIRAMVSGLSAGLSSIKDVGVNLVKGLWNGIKDTASWIKKKIQGFGKGVLDDLKSFFGIHSPSTLLRDEVGKYLGQGVGVGFVDSIQGVSGMVNKALSAEAAKINTDLDVSGNVSANGTATGAGATGAGGVVIYQNNTFAKAHSRYELYKAKQQTAAAVRLALQE